jgi:DNA polymerase-3 subunit epsilon
MRARFVIIWLVCFALLAGVCAAVLWVLYTALPAREQAQFAHALGVESGLLWLLGGIMFTGAGFLARWLEQRYFEPVQRLAESARLIAGSNPAFRAVSHGPAEIRNLAHALNALAERHEATVSNVEERVRQARADSDEEKNRLAALMSELASAVIVCNAGFRILLYNEQARRLFAGSAAPGFLGLGRSLFSLFDRDVIGHAVEQLRYRLEQGDAGPVTLFMTALGAGRVVRVRMVSVTATADAGGRQRKTTGFVLVLDDAGEEAVLAEQRERLLNGLIESVRASLGSMRAAAENLDNFPEMDAVRRVQFTAIISSEAQRLSEALNDTSNRYSALVKSQWQLEQMRASDLLSVVQRRVDSVLGVATTRNEVDASIWVRADSYGIAQAVCYLARRLRDAFAVHALRFEVSTDARHVRFDLVWNGAGLPAATVLSWENLPFSVGGEASPITLREMIERHHGEVWYQSGNGEERSRFRLLLPRAESEKARAKSSQSDESRPEYYDFDLFHQSGQTDELDEQPLKHLTYTVFDTETTGLHPSAGDEIISIGAVRIVNARLLTGEVFDRLIDPQRAIGAESIRIHGIRPELLVGHPTVETVLPAFHRFCEDTVLVGHNAAFDMRFLQLKENAIGVRFTQPVLDTMMLSAVLHPALGNHRLEVIAERFGVDITGRHTALGDAMLTGEVFLRMMPLLADAGIVTLKQAREASERTLHARARY